MAEGEEKKRGEGGGRKGAEKKRRLWGKEGKIGKDEREAEERKRGGRSGEEEVEKGSGRWGGVVRRREENGRRG